jgi:4'-phosphopantetheinyl transferase
VTPGDGVVDIWSAVWSAAIPADAERLAGLLSREELDRAAGCINRNTSHRFIAGRGILRLILARYREVDPRSLQFGYGPWGKPFLKDAADLGFNLSHSGARILYAITGGAQVGIDVEDAATGRPVERLAARVLTAGERSVYTGLGESEKRMAFFQCWTRKEAFVKAAGQGIARPFDQLEVTMDPSESPRLVHVWGSREEASRWSLLNLRAGPGMAGAVALEGHGWRAEYRDFSIN